jgi:hypothetical protein
MKPGILLLIIFGGALAALAVWSLVVEQIAAAQLQASANSNPLLTLLTGSK